VVDDGLVVLAYDVDSEFLVTGWANARMEKRRGERTTMSSDLSSYGSLSRPSGLRRSPLMKVPLELFTSLMKIYRNGR
jgi:hypothetical protein